MNGIKIIALKERNLNNHEQSSWCANNLAHSPERDEYHLFSQTDESVLFFNPFGAVCV